MSTRISRTGRLALVWAAAVAGLVVASGCGGASYLWHVAWGEAEILWGREPIEEVLERPGLDPGTRAKLELVLAARDFGVERLGLEVGESYRSFTALDRAWTSLTLSASPRDRLQPYLWSFPIVGEVPYKGFFDRDRAELEKAELEAQGFDTYLRPVDAFSTLGWFDDPLLSPMLARSESSLADTVLHEALHATYFRKGDVDFNEGLATFVGSQGSLLFLAERWGPGSDRLKQIRALQRDRIWFASFLGDMLDEVERHYASDLSTEAKVEGREPLFRRWKEELEQRVAVSETGAYGWLAKVPWNNALVLSLKRYLFDLSRFERFHRALGSDLRATIAFFAALDEADDPVSAMEAVLAATPAPGTDAQAPGE